MEPRKKGRSQSHDALDDQLLTPPGASGDKRLSLDDQAATKIQANFRGFMAKKKFDEQRKVDSVGFYSRWMLASAENLWEGEGGAELHIV